MALPPDLTLVLDRITGHVADDDRFVGLAAGGSLLSGETDEFSDLDLVVVVADAQHETVMARRKEIAGAWMPLLAAFTGEHVGEPRLLICLCADPLLHVDLKFVTVDELRDRIEDPLVIWQQDDVVTRALAATDAVPLSVDPQWVEDRFWIWTHYAATKLGRGELFEVLEFLAFVRGQVLAPLAERVRGLAAVGVRRFEQHLPDVVADLTATVSTHDREDCARAIAESVALYRRLRDQSSDALSRGTDAEAAAVDYLERVIAKRTSH